MNTTIASVSTEEANCDGVQHWPGSLYLGQYGAKTKNDFAGEGQQQITAVLRVVTERSILPFSEEDAPFQNL